MSVNLRLSRWTRRASRWGTGGGARWTAPWAGVRSVLRSRARAVLALVSVWVVCASLLFADTALGGPGAAAGSARCTKGQIALAANVCSAKGDGRGPRVLAVIRSMRSRYSLRSVVFGVWEGRKPVISGALGNAYPGIGATRAVHIRIGNTTESFETTLLLQLVQAGKIRLSDRLSRWFPALPNANKITVAMLASSTSGYFHYVNDERFIDAVHAAPFRRWTPSELVAVGVGHPMLFAPGTSWSFSDTNFVLLGEILRRVGGMPVAAQIKKKILNPLGMSNTQMTTTAFTPSPVLHGYTTERGVYEDDTFWSPSWATYTGDMTSNLSDMGRWARAVGTGSLLSTRSHDRQISRGTIGLGPLTAKFYYGLAVALDNGWVVAGAPGLEGFSGSVTYLPKKRLTVVIFTTANANAPAGVQFAPAIFKRVGALLAPASAPASLGG